jgi:cytochrome c-type biogenesis protein CcmH
VKRPDAAPRGAPARPQLTLPLCRLALVAFAALAVTGALAGTTRTARASASIVAPRARASLLDVESAVMCPSCHEPLEAVSSPQALFEKAYIKLLIARGDTKQQILYELVAQYGVGVLAKPRASGFNLIFYILPPLALAGGIAFLLITLPKWRRNRSRAAAATALQRPGPLSDADAERIKEDLARLI